MENQSENVKSKKVSVTTIVIVLLVIIVLSLVCYILYDKGILFENKQTSNSDVIEEKPESNKEDKEEEENINFSDSELEKYVNYFYGESAELIYNVDAISAKNLSIKDKINYISLFLFKKSTSSSDYRYSILSEEVVKNAVEEVYGPNSYERTTFNLGCGDYIFNEEDKNYYSRTGCGGTSSNFVRSAITDYKATKSKLEITTSYAVYDPNTNYICKDYQRTIPLGNYAGDLNNDIKEYIKNNKDKLNTIVYTFESTDGINYYFTGFTNNR